MRRWPTPAAAANLALNPPLTHAFDQMHISDYYNAYFSDTWHMKPSFTLTYGMGYTLEMPPAEAERQSRQCWWMLPTSRW